MSPGTIPVQPATELPPGKAVGDMTKLGKAVPGFVNKNMSFEATHIYIYTYIWVLMKYNGNIYIIYI